MNLRKNTSWISKRVDFKKSFLIFFGLQTSHEVSFPPITWIRFDKNVECYCWWFVRPVNSPVEGQVVFPHYLQGVFYVPGGCLICLGFLNHQPVSFDSKWRISSPFFFTSPGSRVREQPSENQHPMSHQLFAPHLDEKFIKNQGPGSSLWPFWDG